MTFGELITDTFREVRESESSPVFFTRDDIKSAINDGYQEISDESEWLEKFITIDIIHTRPYYDLRTLIPDQVLSVGPAFNVTTNRWLIPIDARDLSSTYRHWEDQIEEPHNLLPRGLWWVAYFPFKGTESGTIKQYYSALPADMSDDADVPGFPATYHRALVEFAAHELWPQRGDTNRGIEAWKRYLEFESAVVSHVHGRAGYPSRRMWGAEAGGLYAR